MKRDLAGELRRSSLVHRKLPAARFRNTRPSQKRFTAEPLWGFLVLLAVPAGAGTIEGTVSGPSDLSKVVVYLEGSSGATAGEAVYHLDQKYREFVPGVLVVPVGATVVFHNSDDFLHNIHGRSGNRTLFNWGMPPEAPPLRRRFDQTGEVLLSCDVHPEMEAWIKVAPNVHFTQARRDGRYRLENVPPGEHVLTAWHPKAGAQSLRLRVTPEGVSEVDLKLGF